MPQIPRGNAAKCHVVVSVTQQYETNPALGSSMRGGGGSGSGANTPAAVKRKKKRKKLHHIGFAVYEVPPHMTRLTPIYVAEHVSGRNLVLPSVVAWKIRVAIQ